MKNVEFLFQNLQSHENTRFTLKPGINFIIGDNNAGKSAIFKVLNRIIKAPNVSSSKIASLIRYGCSEATAAFKFDNEIVVARFTKYDREAAKIFFEHTHADGQVTRSVFCPKSLLDALGIVVGENGEIINFNDANSVQLISEVSTEADNIITHVMLDQKVETIKRNLYSLGREVNSDAKSLDYKVKLLEDNLKEWSYRPIVDEFFEKYDTMSAICQLCDCIPNVDFSDRKLPSHEDLQFHEELLKLIQGISNLDVLRPSDSESWDLRQLGTVIWLLEHFESVPNIVADLQKRTPGFEELVKCRQLNSAISKCLGAVRAAEHLLTYNSKLIKLAQERQEVFGQLTHNTKQVDCPIKGKVYYTDEKCIPYSS